MSTTTRTYHSESAWRNARPIIPATITEETARRLLDAWEAARPPVPCDGTEPAQRPDGSWPRDYCGASHAPRQACP